MREIVTCARILPGILRRRKMNFVTAVQTGSPVYTSQEVAGLQQAVRATTARGNELELTFDNSGDQAIVVNPDEDVLDQFVYRPSNTILIGDTPPDTQRALLTGLLVADLPEVDLPAEFDARTKWPGLITIPMEQGQCGSCWAFAAATAFSDRLRIKDPSNKELKDLANYRPFGTRNITYRILNNLSPYEQAECDKTCVVGEPQYCNSGCTGGFLRPAYEYLKSAGLSTLLCNPPTCDPTKATCQCTKGKSCTVYKAKSIYTFDRNSSDDVKKKWIQKQVLTLGPVTIGFMVYASFNTFFASTPNGVYTDAQTVGSEKAGGHAVDIIGWGSQPVFHWLIRNSWSPVWGQDGHFRIQYNYKGLLNECYGAEA